MISVLIPTKNEEKNLPGCLDSLPWADDVWVHDSGSSDATRDIAASAGAHFIQRNANTTQEVFDGDEAEHKNWALDSIPFKYKWVLHLDADERLTPELAASIRLAVENPDDNVAYRIQRRDFWERRWLKHVVASSYYIRLFRPEKMRYRRRINPIPVPHGKVSDLSGYIDHYPFNRGITHWLNRHNSYSTLEAQEVSSRNLGNGGLNLGKALFGGDFHQRRFHQKQLFYHIPGRPLFKFVLLYLGKRGFLDGTPGFRYALLQSFYEYMIVLKTSELHRRTTAYIPPTTAARRTADTDLGEILTGQNLPD